jgi:hypothetical protein
MDNDVVRERIERDGLTLSEALTRMASLLKDKKFLDAINQIRTNPEARQLAKRSSSEFFKQYGIEDAHALLLSVKSSPVSPAVSVSACFDLLFTIFGKKRVCVTYTEEYGWSIFFE